MSKDKEKLDDGHLITGGVMSTTVMAKLQLPVLLDGSVPTQVTAVEPTEKLLPELFEHTITTATPLLSEAKTVHVTETVFVLFGSARGVNKGQVTVGACKSTTNIRKEQLAEFLALSDAVQVTVVLPAATTIPGAGAHTTAPLTPTASVATGIP